jgi:hypothetical protein
MKVKKQKNMHTNIERELGPCSGMILDPPGCSPSHLEISSTMLSSRSRVSPLPGVHMRNEIERRGS